MSVQISTYISDETKSKMDFYSQNHGLKKGYIIEEALKHYFQALKALPTNAITPNSIVLKKEIEQTPITKVQNAKLNKLLNEN